MLNTKVMVEVTTEFARVLEPLLAAWHMLVWCVTLFVDVALTDHAIPRR